LARPSGRRSGKPG